MGQVGHLGPMGNGDITKGPVCPIGLMSPICPIDHMMPNLGVLTGRRRHLRLGLKVRPVGDGGTPSLLPFVASVLKS